VISEYYRQPFADLVNRRSDAMRRILKRSRSGEVQLAGQLGERPLPGEVRLQQAHRVPDGRPGRPGLAEQHPLGLRDGLAELAEQQRQVTEPPTRRRCAQR
jgi:hypothetical protein